MVKMEGRRKEGRRKISTYLEVPFFFRTLICSMAVHWEAARGRPPAEWHG
jgi:hypothetical protein